MNSVFTLDELFTGKVLIVPDYQRGYAWEQKQWNDFLEDLEYLGDGKHHYTGTVVCIRKQRLFGTKRAAATRRFTLSTASSA